MKIEFYKYQGTGNDFIILDNTFKQYNKIPVKQLCDRKFGIGADGLMLLEQLTGYDFKMVYYNSDGNESSMCGNGGRCLAAFANKKKLGANGLLNFLAIDGEHQAKVLEDGIISLKMNDVSKIEKNDNTLILDTGSPHYITFVEDIQKLDIVTEARKIRYSQKFEKQGINVNFIKPLASNQIEVRTYERGVEDETLSCGTGVTACAIAQSEVDGFSNGLHEVNINTQGGNLKVSFEKSDEGYKNIWLTGPAIEVFSGTINV